MHKIPKITFSPVSKGASEKCTVPYEEPTEVFGP